MSMGWHSFAWAGTATHPFPRQCDGALMEAGGDLAPMAARPDQGTRQTEARMQQRLATLAQGPGEVRPRLPVALLGAGEAADNLRMFDNAEEDSRDGRPCTGLPDVALHTAA
jgi:hypothetical protein